MDNNLLIALLGILLMVILILMKMPIGIALGIVGFVGFAYMASPAAAFGLLKTVPYTTVADYTLSVIPLFVLMGNFALVAGLSESLYNLGHKLVGHIPGGLAVATMIACAGFGAICGSAPATTATMGAISIPEMRKRGYDPALTCGCVAAGGCLGLLIPPSVGFIIYGVLVGASIGKLFTAGIVVGLLLLLLYSIVIVIVAIKNPEKAPRTNKSSLKEMLVAIRDVWGVLVLFLLVIGGMMAGWFTATEGAAVGAVGAFIFALFSGKMTWKAFLDALIETGKTTAMIFTIMIGAYLLGYFLSVTRLPTILADIITKSGMNRYLVIILIYLVYVFLGCIMDSLAMILITIPIFYPSVMALGFDPIWFGAFVVLVINQGLLTPPVGMNCFVVKGITKDVPLHTIFKGVLPFWLCITVAAIIILVFPDVATFLPELTAAA